MTDFPKHPDVTQQAEPAEKQVPNEESDVPQQTEPAEKQPPNETKQSLIQELREVLKAQTSQFTRSKDHCLRMGERLSKLKNMGYKGKAKLEQLCQQIGYDLTYSEAIQFIAISENVELRKYWDRVEFRGYSPAYQFTILTKYPDAFEDYRKKHLTGKGPFHLIRSKIVALIPPRTHGQRQEKPAQLATAAIPEQTIGCTLELKDEGQASAFVEAVVMLSGQFTVKLTPTSAFTTIQETLNAKVPDVE